MHKPLGSEVRKHTENVGLLSTVQDFRIAQFQKDNGLSPVIRLRFASDLLPPFAVLLSVSRNTTVTMGQS